MKLSISLPDDLWDRAREVLHTQTSPSAIVQEALRRAVSSGAARPEYADAARDEETRTVMTEVRTRLVKEARMSYQNGYRSGVALAQKLSWQELEWISSAPVDLCARAKAVLDLAQRQMVDDPQYIPGTEPMIDPNVLGEYLGSLAHPLLDWTPEPVALEGIAAALTDIRSSVEYTQIIIESSPSTPEIATS